MYINHIVEGKQTLGSISCNPTTYRPLRLIPSQCHETTAHGATRLESVVLGVEPYIVC